MSDELRQKLSEAVACFWQTRDSQQESQGSLTGQKDQGARSAVTGGKHCDGLVKLIRELLVSAGVPNAQIFTKKSETMIPGYFRPEKQWDLIVVANGDLIASIEFKSHVGPSFGNNFNNRTEEALGCVLDLLTAFREGSFKDSIKPWLGWFMLLEDCENSNKPVGSEQKHFPVRPEFVRSSYVKRYEIFCQRLVRENLYNAACLILSPRGEGRRGVFSEPSEEVGFLRFASSLMGHAVGYAKLREGRAGDGLF